MLATEREGCRLNSSPDDEPPVKEERAMNDIEQLDPETQNAVIHFERGYMDGIENRATMGIASEWYERGFARGIRASRFHEHTTKPEKHRACDRAVSEQFSTTY